MTPESSPAPRSPSQGPGGTLFLVGSPIGNLEDMTLRAIRTLKEVDLIACEDTRRTQKLLDHYRIETPTTSYHEHNELTRAPELIIQMEEGGQIALVSDAGMPLISDPGHRLVKLAIRHDLRVVPIPGPSALVAVLSAAGLPVDKFRFLGFLPSKKLQRRRALEALKDANKTLVFYESPHRIVAMMADVAKALGERQVVVAREVTKIHEEFLRGTVSGVLEHLRKKPVKGEITVLVGPPSEIPAEPFADAAPDHSILKALKLVMAEKGLDERSALKVAARTLGLSRSEAYRQWQIEKSAKKR
jgi:16S rRNA (cytidine1402-2'-O)-methyltransferase